jgi:hypothetical protein
VSITIFSGDSTRYRPAAVQDVVDADEVYGRCPGGCHRRARRFRSELRGGLLMHRGVVAVLAVLALLGVTVVAVAYNRADPEPPPRRSATDTTTGARTGVRADVSTDSTTAAPATSPEAPHDCLSQDRRDNGRVAKVRGSKTAVRVQDVADQRTYDLRGATIVGYPKASRYALLFGKRTPGVATCVVGGTVLGQQARSHTWQTMKRQLDGDGLNFKSQGGLVDGMRIDNLEDGIGTIGGDPTGIVIRNIHLSYIRDDCIENDAIVQLLVQDSLLDGCFTGLSLRPGANAHPRSAPAGERTQLERVLLRLQPMPYRRDQAKCKRDGLGTGGFFKWSPYANQLVVTDSVLLAERIAARCSRAMNFPKGVYQNVTLVWLGPGDYPGKLPARGVTVTNDRAVWDRAKADWLTRHGSAASAP